MIDYDYGAKKYDIAVIFLIELVYHGILQHQ